MKERKKEKKQNFDIQVQCLLRKRWTKIFTEIFYEPTFFLKEEGGNKKIKGGVKKLWTKRLLVENIFGQKNLCQTNRVIKKSLVLKIFGPMNIFDL